MKLIIDIDDSSYINCKNLLKEGTHTYEQLVIAKGIPYEEKTAHWIRQETPFGYANSYECSECGRVIWNDDGEEGLEDFPYCHCGCRMIKEKKE